MLVRSSQVTFLAALGLGLLAGGCSSSQNAADKVASLTAAGFEKHSAATPKQQALMDQLPPNKLVQRQWKGRTIFVYADPKGCNCVYVGNQDAFARYQQTAHEQMDMATANQGFDGEAWGMSGWRS